MTLDDDQLAAIDRLVTFDHTLLVAGMGAGKTVIAMSAIEELTALVPGARFLVVAPKTVAEKTWPEERLAWAHLHDLKMRIAVGTPEQRRRAFDSDAQIVVINYETLAWAVREYDLPGMFWGVVFDESDKMKSTGGETFKRFRRLIPKFEWRLCMSGTPVSENLHALFGQMLIVDGGKSLGRNRQRYLDRYFLPMDFHQYNWTPRATAYGEIAKRVGGYVHVVPDYTHILPPLVIEQIPVTLPPGAMDTYRMLARESAIDGVTAVNEAVLTGKLQQVAAGDVYTDDEEQDEYRTIHDAKWLAFDEWLLRRRPAPAIIVYWWQFQKDRLKARNIPIFSGDLIEPWNRGEIPYMGLHPKSAGHGLNLQHGGARMLWLSPQWSRVMWDQTIARLWRRGQRYEVLVEVLTAVDTVDEIVIERREGKGAFHEKFLAHLERCR